MSSDFDRRAFQPCPRAAAPPRYPCAGGCGGVLPGERYVTLDGQLWCERCLSRVAGRKALKLLAAATAFAL